MANEVKYTYASQVTLEASGASGASDNFIAADDADLTSANHSDYLFGDFALTCVLGGAPTNAVINLYRRDLNIDGAADDAVPSTTYARTYVGLFAIPVSDSGTYSLTDVPLTQDCEFYIENKTGQSLSAGWVLKVTPKSYAPAT